MCLACNRLSSARICDGCRCALAPAPERIVGEGLRVVAAFVHEGPAKQLVHGLKYRGVLGYADVAAAAVAHLVPPLPLVPVPRVLTRRLRYGVVPSGELAAALAALTGGPVVRLLGGPIHAPRRAGGDHGARPPRFRVVSPPPGGIILVDDVVTTGGTLVAAAGAIGPGRVVMAVAANSARKRSV